MANKFGNTRDFRDSWIEDVCANFSMVKTDSKQANYWRIILETLWPKDCDLPGPVIYMSSLKEALEAYRSRQYNDHKPYTDLARRIRELQGEEGVAGIEKLGSSSYTRYQLVSTDLKPKREKRSSLAKKILPALLQSCGSRCAICGRNVAEARGVQVDHKIPRTRNGQESIENYQILCNECNNIKSTACRGCKLDCEICSWAYPEKFAPINLSNLNILRVREYARTEETSPSEMLNRIVDDFFD